MKDYTKGDFTVIGLIFILILVVILLCVSAELTTAHYVGANVLIHNAHHGFVIDIRADDAGAEMSAAGPGYFSFVSDEPIALYHGEEKEKIPLGITWERYFAIESTNIESMRVEILEGSFSLAIHGESPVTVDYWPTDEYAWTLLTIGVGVWLAIILAISFMIWLVFED